MKKLLGALFAGALLSANIFAYNPPAGGQNILKLTSPQLIYGANSAAGGALFGTTPSSILNNPALSAWEQRGTLDLAGTLLVNSNTDDVPFGKKVGIGMEAGLLIPSRWCVSTFLFQGLWTEFFDMPVGNNIAFTAGVSKDITDQVSVGLTGNFGLLYGDAADSDWMASAALGVFYNHGDIGFMKDVRFGVSLNNLGKMYDTGAEAWGIKTAKNYRDWLDAGATGEFSSSDKGTAWPGIATLRTGAAATLLSTNAMDLGLSLDLSYPAFQDLVVDLGLQFRFSDFLNIFVAEQLDVQELANDAKNLLPSVGASFKFTFRSKSGSYLSQHDWEESEMTASAAWKQLYKNINAISAGLIMNLGMADTKAPEIIMWGDE